MQYFIILMVLIVTTLSGCAGPDHGLNGDNNLNPAAEADAAPDDLRISEYILGPGDEVAINVWRNAELNMTQKIGPTGILSFPLVGDLKVSGMGITQLREELRKGLSRYIVDPQISVNVSGAKSKKVFVLGEVTNPGIFQLDGPMTVIEAVSRAGGFTLDAKSNNVLLIRGDINKPKLISLNIEKALEKGALKDNVSLQQGDVIYVPASFIADVDRFFGHLHNILSPIVLLESGITLVPSSVQAIRGGKGATGSTIVIQPSR